MAVTISEAQADSRRAYAGGGPGAVVSGTIWPIAGFTHQSQGVSTAFVVLFFGGMLIFPLSTAIERTILACPKPSPGNSLQWVALESTIAMIGGLFAAWLMVPFAPDYVFPLATIAVGGHYFAFKTLYGDSTYWLLAALLMGAGFIAIYRIMLTTETLIFAVAAIEIAFGMILSLRARSND